MIRIVFPLLIAITAFIGPWFSEEIEGARTGKTTVNHSGEFYVGSTVDCFMNKNYSVSGDCKPSQGMEGMLIFGAIASSLVAAVLGVIGLLPIIGRLTSLVTTAAGGLSVAAFGNFLMGMLSSDAVTMADVGWGAYAMGGLGLITLLAGVFGMKGSSR